MWGVLLGAFLKRAFCRALFACRCSGRVFVPLLGSLFDCWGVSSLFSRLGEAALGRFPGAVSVSAGPCRPHPQQRPRPAQPSPAERGPPRPRAALSLACPAPPAARKVKPFPGFWPLDPQNTSCRGDEQSGAGARGKLIPLFRFVLRTTHSTAEHHLGVEGCPQHFWASLFSRYSNFAVIFCLLLLRLLVNCWVFFTYLYFPSFLSGGKGLVKPMKETAHSRVFFKLSQTKT